MKPKNKDAKLGKYSYAHLVKTRPEFGLPLDYQSFKSYWEFEWLRSCKTVPELVAALTAGILSGEYVPDDGLPF